MKTIRVICILITALLIAAVLYFAATPGGRATWNN